MPLKKIKTYFQKTKKIELDLIQNLKLLGSVLLVIGAVFLYLALQYSFWAPPCLEDLPDGIPHPHESFNFFRLSALFFLIALLCLFVAYKRKRKLRKK